MAEQTSKRVATIAGKVLRALKDEKVPAGEHVGCLSFHRSRAGILMGICTAGELRALAASALTQSPDRPKAKARRAGK